MSIASQFGLVEFRNYLPEGPARRAASTWLMPPEAQEVAVGGEPRTPTPLTQWASYVVTMHVGPRRRSSVVMFYSPDPESPHQLRHEGVVALPVGLGATTAHPREQLAMLFARVGEASDLLGAYGVTYGLSGGADSRSEFELIRPALEDRRWDFRTLEGVARDSGLDIATVKRIVTENSDKVRRPSVPIGDRRELYTLANRRPWRETYTRLRALAARVVP